MEFIGIDLGNHKTVIASSRENGRILTDEQSKRTIKTMMELTLPTREFGNSITSECEATLDLRHRQFRDAILTKEGQSNIFMFLKYLNRIIKKNTPTNPSICIAIPIYWSEEERAILHALCKAADMKISGFVNDITGIGIYACLRRENIPTQYMIIDFGNSKSSVGLFTYENFTFKPILFDCVKVGADHFDQKIIDLIFKKYGIGRSKLAEEKIKRVIDKFKTALNSTEVSTTQLYIAETPLNISISRDEVKEVIKEDLAKISDFLMFIKTKYNFEGHIEIVGGNSSSFVIRDLLDFNYQVQLDSNDSTAIGAALGSACATLNTKFKMHDIIGREIYVKMKGENTRPIKIFEADSIVGSAAKNLTYKRKTSFDIEVYELPGYKIVDRMVKKEVTEDKADNDEEEKVKTPEKPLDLTLIGTLNVEKEETGEVEPVNVSIYVNRFNLVEIRNVDGATVQGYEYKTFTLDQSILDEMISAEGEYEKLENDLARIGDMRNEIETAAMGLADILESKFNSLMTEEELSNIKMVTMDLFDVEPSDTVEKELKVRENVLSQLQFVTDKLNGLSEDIMARLIHAKAEINQLKSDFPKIYTPALYKLQGLLYKIDDVTKDFKIDVFNLGKIDLTALQTMVNEVKTHLVTARKEALDKIEEDRKKREKAAEGANKAEPDQPKEEATNQENAEAGQEDASKEEEGGEGEERDE